MLYQVQSTHETILVLLKIAIQACVTHGIKSMMPHAMKVVVKLKELALLWPLHLAVDPTRLQERIGGAIPLSERVEYCPVIGRFSFPRTDSSD